MFSSRNFAFLLLVCSLMQNAFAGKTIDRNNYIKQEDGTWQHLKGAYKGKRVKSKYILDKLNSTTESDEDSSDQSSSDKDSLELLLLDLDCMKITHMDHPTEGLSDLIHEIKQNTDSLFAINELLSNPSLLNKTDNNSMDSGYTVVCKLIMKYLESESNKKLRALTLKNHQLIFQVGESEMYLRFMKICENNNNDNPENYLSFINWLNSIELQNSRAYKMLWHSINYVYGVSSWSAKRAHIIAFLYGIWYLASANCSQEAIAGNFTQLCTSINLPATLESYIVGPIVASALAFIKYYNEDELDEEPIPTH